MIKFKMTDVQKSCLIFNYLLKKNIIIDLVKNKKDEFDSKYTNVSKNTIGNFLLTRSNNFSPEVKTYTPKWLWSSAYATTYSGNYNYIGLNSRKLNRNISSIVGSIAHEWGHCFEYYIQKEHEKQTFFNHGDNSPIGKDNTFQYWLGREVKRYVQDNLDELLRNIGIE